MGERYHCCLVYFAGIHKHDGSFGILDQPALKLGNVSRVGREALLEEKALVARNAVLALKLSAKYAIDRS